MIIISLDNFSCPLCNKYCKNQRSLSKHLQYKHKISFLKFLDSKKLIPSCLICSNNAKWYRGLKFLSVCSKKCHLKLMNKINKQKNRRKILSEKRKNYLKENKNKHNWSLFNKRQSKPEQNFEKILSTFKIDDAIIKWYIPENSERFFEIDFVLKQNKIGFEINGNQHYTKRKTLRSYYKKRQSYLEKLGWKIFNIHYLFCFDENEMTSFIVSILEKNKINFSKTNLESKILSKKQIKMAQKT
jgi:very-short-patch-repair endonuclease